MSVARLVAMAALTISLCGHSLSQTPPPTPPAPSTPAPVPAALQAVPALDLARYQGLWYQAALYPNRFQRQCRSGTQAEYTVRSDGTIRVNNSCINASSGLREYALGRARAVGTVQQGQLSPGKLEVSFLPGWIAWLPIGWADYWVIQLAPDYRYAVIGNPTREFLWVLSRSKSLPDSDWTAIRAQLIVQGYDPGRLVMDRHD